MFKYRISAIGTAIFLLFLLGACSSPHPPVHIEGELLAIDSLRVGAPDAAVDSVIAIYRADLEAEMNQVLAHSAQLMERGTPEGLLNNFVADLVMDRGVELYDPANGPIDFTLLNYGGLRRSIPEGPVTRARIFELMPFENEMVVLTISPQRTEELFDYLVESEVGMPVSGLRLVIEGGELQSVRIGGEPFDRSRPYRILTSDYLAGGGDRMVFFLDPMDTEYLGMRIRDAILDKLMYHGERGEKIESSLDGRISVQ